MLLINNTFLDNILDKGLKARYNENSQVFLTDLKNLIIAKNRFKLGKFEDKLCVEDSESSKINLSFEGIKFDIRQARLEGKKEIEIKPQKVDYVKEQAKKHFEEINTNEKLRFLISIPKLKSSGVKYLQSFKTSLLEKFTNSPDNSLKEG